MGIGGNTFTVGVLGSYGGLNVGDEAILSCVLDCVRHRTPEAKVVVFSRNPEHTRVSHSVSAVVPWQGVSRDRTLAEVRELDLLMLGGGGVLFDQDARLYARVVRTAQDSGVPTFAYAIGVGPLSEPEDRNAAREAVEEMTDVVVRDEESKLVLEDVGVNRPVTVTADPALLLKAQPFTTEMLAREGVVKSGPLVGLSVREPGRAAQNLDEDSYHSLIAEMADFLVNRLDANLLFVPMERDDIRHSHAVMSHMSSPERGRVLNERYSPGQILGLMRHLDMVVGMRLHFLIFATLTGVPLLPLPYAGKVFDFARAVGAPTLTGVARQEVGPLLAEADRLWDERPERSRMLLAQAEELKRRAHETCERYAALARRIASGGGHDAGAERP
ncbi:polysaccharide pyruvyl transferase [Bailinhaonella thermotolerans]|uniref:Polysaccharide pyruvyl transferase n=2 Tax=Bailinhaonella thermotolerans TaxID=1070861 RepID=A0A3A4AGQ0_9ACTN|nr:polysaccharide pyruvyl transferase [Bailinhaonella thermotolerans]